MITRYLSVSEIMTSISPPIASSSRCAKTTSSLLFPDLHSPRQTLFIAILFICLSTTIAVTTPPTFTRLPRSVWLVSTLALRTSFRLFHYFNNNHLSPTFPLLPLLSRSSSFSMLPSITSLFPTLTTLTALSLLSLLPLFPLPSPAFAPIPWSQKQQDWVYLRQTREHRARMPGRWRSASPLLLDEGREGDRRSRRSLQHQSLHWPRRRWKSRESQNCRTQRGWSRVRTNSDNCKKVEIWVKFQGIALMYPSLTMCYSVSLRYYQCKAKNVHGIALSQVVYLKEVSLLQHCLLKIKMLYVTRNLSLLFSRTFTKSVSRCEEKRR